MKRLNFLPKKRFTVWPDWSFVEVSDRTQNAFLACAAAIALLSIVGFLETQRIVQAQVDSRRAATHLADIERREADVHTVAQALTSLSAVARNVESTRAFSHNRLAAFTHIGDLLPDGIWITDLANAQQTISLKGRARNAALLGEALRAIGHDRVYREPQLVGAHEHNEGNAHFIDFEFSIGLGEKI